MGISFSYSMGIDTKLSPKIITLPYPLILQKSAREALGLSIKDHVVIIDEAHNLMDAISNLHSVTVTLAQLQLATSQLTTYALKFKTRLRGKNRSYIAQVIRLIGSIAGHLTLLKSSGVEGSVHVSDLMSGKGVDQINPYKLSQYLRESKLARKVDGYAESQSTADEHSETTYTTPVLFHIQSFLLPLMNPSAEGRLFYQKLSNDNIQLRYMLLDPTNHFREIVDDARAVILAGGTMSPVRFFFLCDLFAHTKTDTYYIDVRLCQPSLFLPSTFPIGDIQLWPCHPTRESNHTSPIERSPWNRIHLYL